MAEALTLGARIARRLSHETGRLRLGLETLAGTRLHDLVAPRRSIRRAGRLPRGRRVAIYVIFPRSGLAASHLLAIRHLAEAGYAPFVVSNAPLSEADRRRVAEEAWRYLERPNFGYDFGAYRAGILSLGPELGELDALALANDSVWFPLPGGFDWLAEAERTGADLVGAVDNYAVAVPALAAFCETVWRHDRTRPSFHYCSFALRFSRRALVDPVFLRYWRGLRLSDDKVITVRRGEIGLSQRLIGAGLGHAALIDMHDFGDEIAALDAESVRRMLAGLVIPEDGPLRRLRDEVLARSDEAGWAATARAFLLFAVAKTGIAYALPAWAHAARRSAFLKKSPLRLDPAGAAETLRFVGSLEGPGAVEIRAEARALAAVAPGR